MKKMLALILLINSISAIQKFAVVGAGPAGIAVVGLLLDLCIPAKDITWIDPKFNVGDLVNYPTVPANTKNKLFTDFLASCKTFEKVASDSDSIKYLYKLDLDKEYPLATIIEPLQAITKYLLKKVEPIHGKVEQLFFKDDNWNLLVNDDLIVSSHVILATGSRPKQMDLNEFNLADISLIDALDKNKLSYLVNKNDNIAVIGGAHSAVLVMKNLSELNVNKIYNFYRSPIKYVKDMGSWYLNLYDGLKGVAAEWAKHVLEENPPNNLLRILSIDYSIKKYLPECNKVVQAWGFTANDLPLAESYSYNDASGVIAPRLFGIGIAFPEKYVDPSGNIEHRIGIYSFMEYAQRMLPEWIKTKNCNRKTILANFSDLFTIEAL